MDKRYQVFVSSTYEDLQEERKEVMQALLELDCIPAGMELFPASNEDQWTLIKRVIDDCDYYVLIIGGRYGSTNDDGISYTQMEFEYALNTGKPIISFLPKSPDEIPTGKCEKTEVGKKKLDEFKVIAQKKLVKFWNTPEDLGSVVSRSIIKLIKEFPAIGWVKADNIFDENASKEILKLQKENEELKKELNVIATLPPKGTEKFSQGEDEINISFSFYGYLENARYSDSYKCNSDYNFTWNEIFEAVAPDLIGECTDQTLRANVNRLISLYSSEILEDKKYKEKRVVKGKSFSIIKEDFNTIKVQLKALGLIKLSSKNKSVKNTDEYWTLTEYGDYLLTQLLAISKD